MNKKYILGFIVMLLLVSTISAFDFDNIKTYDAESQTITITNAFGLGERLVRMQLMTPIHNKVGIGEDIQVALIKIHEYKKIDGAITGTKTYDYSSMLPLDKDITMKYKEDYEVEVPNYIQDCSRKLENGTDECITTQSGTKIIEKTRWIKFTDINELPDKNNIFIGLYADTTNGERVEWIPDRWFGERIDEWADWTAGLNVDLQHYYECNSVAGNVLIDSIGNINGTISGAIADGDGALGGAVYFDGVNDWVNLTRENGILGYEQVTISLWYRLNESFDNQGTFVSTNNGVNGNDDAIDMRHWNSASGIYLMKYYNSSTSLANNLITPSPIPAQSKWYHIVHSMDADRAYFWHNGTLILNVTRNNTGEGVLYPLPSNDVRLGSAGGYYYLKGSLDEIAFWNRSLSQAEVDILFSNGVPPSYQSEFDNAPTVTLNSPANDTEFKTQSVTFNCSASDDQAITNVSLYIDGVINETNSSGLNNTNYIFTKTLDWNTDYNWTCTGYDNASQQGTTETRTLRIDNDAPIVTLNSPANNTEFLGTSKDFNCSAYDDIQVSQVHFFLDGVLNETNSSGLNNTDYIFTKTLNVDTTYNWTCVVTDNAGQNGTTETREMSLFNRVLLNFTQGISPTCTITNGAIDTNYYWSGETNDSYPNTLSCSLTGYYDLSQTIYANASVQSFTMTDKAMTIYFEYSNGSSATVTGYWTDENVTTNFTASSLVINVTDVLEGITKVYWGFNDTLMNYTQFYHFDNDWVTAVSENMTVLTADDLVPVYIKIKDESGNPINDALIRLSFSDPSVGGTYMEMGQKITGTGGSNGMVLFYVDPDSQVQIRVTKTDFTASELNINIKNSSYTSTNPLTITLRRGDSLVKNQVSFTVCTAYDDTMSSIPVFVYAPSRTLIQFNTSQNSQLYDIDLNIFKTGNSTLIQGVHYMNNTLNDIVVHVYADGTYIGNYTIKYDVRTDVIPVPSGLNTDFVRKMAWILLILLSGIIGLMIGRGEGELESGAIGKSVFIIGCLLLSIVFNGYFGYLIPIVAFYGIGLLIKKWISE